MILSTALKAFGGLGIIVGFLAIMGSANDCDGHCMEYANDLPTMLMVIGYGLLCIIGGAACLSASRYV